MFTELYKKLCILHGQVFVMYANYDDDLGSQLPNATQKVLLKSVPLQKHAHATTELFLVIKINIFTGKISIFFNIFAQNVDCGYTLKPPHNLCFGLKIRKLGIPL